MKSKSSRSKWWCATWRPGPLSKRLGIEEGTPLPRSIIELYYKNDKLNDPMVTEEHVTAFGWAIAAGNGRHRAHVDPHQ